MALTIDQILSTKCPDLYADPNRATYIALAKDRVSSCAFGLNYNLAVALLAAHDYTMDSRTLASAGTISSKKEGGLSISYGGISAVGDLEQSTYGMAFKRLAKSSRLGIAVLGSNDTLCNR